MKSSEADREGTQESSRSHSGERTFLSATTTTSSSNTSSTMFSVSHFSSSPYGSNPSQLFSSFPVSPPALTSFSSLSSSSPPSTSQLHKVASYPPYGNSPSTPYLPIQNQLSSSLSLPTSNFPSLSSSSISSSAPSPSSPPLPHLADINIPKKRGRPRNQPKSATRAPVKILPHLQAGGGGSSSQSQPQSPSSPPPQQAVSSSFNYFPASSPTHSMTSRSPSPSSFSTSPSNSTSSSASHTSGGNFSQQHQSLYHQEPSTFYQSNNSLLGSPEPKLPPPSFQQHRGTPPQNFYEALQTPFFSHQLPFSLHSQQREPLQQLPPLRSLHGFDPWSATSSKTETIVKSETLSQHSSSITSSISPYSLPSSHRNHPTSLSFQKELVFPPSTLPSEWATLNDLQTKSSKAYQPWQWSSHTSSEKETKSQSPDTSGSDGPEMKRKRVGEKESEERAEEEAAKKSRSLDINFLIN